ncbi:MAG TPA: dihydroorotate dehydrogenase electron transfer subunit [Chloroflexota bacterium]|nr:dihydroorotate dehydrogenase electron transfer subunit [Chloroflexota bacterium]
MPAPVNAEVVANASLSEALFWITLRCQPIARTARAGQFVHLLSGDSNDPLLRRPYSLSAIDSEAATFSILYQVVGRGSAWLSRRRPGDRVDTLGPLGSHFAIESGSRHLLMIGGGIGMGPLVALAASAGDDADTVIINGGRTADALLPTAFLPAAAELHLATDDGSAGTRGTAVDLMPEWYDWADQVFACGPSPMLQALEAALKLQTGRKTVQFALEARMACGLGVCHSCVVTTRRGPKRVCTEGPIFARQDLTWRWETGI